ncbi:hypothetical protein BV22DRAFT_1107315 [Leucogyrophana mollusca]|uniref:Uncharacterized protein n=1 Tax=Leucogyrophana mollusca TaxID=85980 RepID=A0ACB8B702_9AGAM|nr:hypothetical protein BV22DRAFT_1107315 [Leucogyrophana mollusca]
MEPFLRLPTPNQNIVITPPRLIDQNAMVSILNDPRVYHWMETPSIPFLPEHAKQRIEKAKERADALLSDLRDAVRTTSIADAALTMMDGCPVRSIREVQDDGTQTYIGDIMIRRASFEEVLDGDERLRMIQENDNKVVGDPTIWWSFGFYLAASHHGRGIMSAAMGVILFSWAIPRMGVKRMTGYTFVGNAGSLRVFEKNGFVLRGTLDNGKVVRGEKRLLNHLEWILQDS